MKRKRRQVEVDLQRLDGIVDSSRERPLEEEEREVLRTALHEMASRLASWRNSEKTSQVAGEGSATGLRIPKEKSSTSGHGRNGADAFSGAERIAVPHPELSPGCPCPGCLKGKVYPQRKGASPVIRFSAGPPIGATVYELESLRCNLCQEIFKAQTPEGVGAEKYDETAASMVAVAKYGHGIPLNRLEAIQQSLGVPLPASTQWEILEDAAELVEPAGSELTRQAADAQLLHTDDTGMKVLEEVRPTGEKRTGQFTTGMVAELKEGHRAALFFTGTRHAGENLGELLQRRASGLAAPTLMCDALSRNIPKLSPEIELVIANCLAHGRRHFVQLADNFPDECRHVLEVLGGVYRADSEAREAGMDAKQRLKHHQQHSGPLMKELRQWLTSQIEENRTEPNSGLGKAMKYLLTHWSALTLFLRHPGAPLDNNVCERALKKVVLHRKNALFYRTMNGARVRDLFMTLVHTCELNGVNPFVYLTEIQRHADELRAAPGSWMPWNYKAQLTRAGPA